MEDAPVCEVCGSQFTADRFNCSRQRCCGRRKCILRLNALRQARYRAEHADDGGRRAAEVCRVQTWRKAVAEAARQRDGPSSVALAFLGSVSHSLGDPDVSEVSSYLRHCMDRGRRIAVCLEGVSSFSESP